MPTRILGTADLTPVVSSGVVLTTFDLDADKTNVAVTQSLRLGLSIETVVSSAVATGLSLLYGVDPGPFTLDGTSRQYLPPVIP